MRKNKLKIVAIIIFSFILLPLGLLIGNINIPLKDFFTEKYSFIIWNIRFPRTVGSFLGGAALSISGLILQILFSNPLAGPFVLGISSASLVGAILVIFIFTVPSFFTLSIFSIIFSFLMILVVLFFAKRLQKKESILIIGIMIGYFLSALINIIIYFAPAKEVKDFHIWILGSFARLPIDVIPFYSLVILSLLIFTLFLIKPLNAFQMGEVYANVIGIDTSKYLYIFVLISSILTAIVTSFAGPIAFIGLASPHIARYIFDSVDNKIIVTATIFIGGNLLLLCDILSRIILPPNDIPVGLVTSLLGAPIVVLLIWRNINK